MPKSKSDVHITPDRVWEIIEQNWGYKKEDLFDPCPINHTIDGLMTNWHHWNYVNPPYSLLKEFVRKAIKESKNNKTIMLLPAKTDQLWFHQLIENHYDIIWIKGRLKFKNNKWSATQPHFLVMIE